MELRILGSVEIHDGTTAVELRRTGERCVLATLALSIGRRVHIDTLVEHVWDEHPPAIEQGGGQRAWLSNHRPGSYRLDLDPSLVDYHRFTAHVARARDQERAGALDDATTAYQHAVQLWRGAALANVTGQWAEHRRYSIEQEYLDAVCALCDRQLARSEFAAVATSARHLIAEVTPTDRMIILALRGLAGSGQHAAIGEFTDRASRRMWEMAEAKPSAEVLDLAAHLVSHPATWLAVPSVAASGLPLPGAVNEQTVAGMPDRHSVVMAASHNGQVYQAAGDQYIS